MWTLVLFTMVAGIGGSGVHSTVTTFNFDTNLQCEAVAKALAETGGFGGAPNSPAATYRVWGKCITPAPK